MSKNSLVKRKKKISSEEKRQLAHELHDQVVEITETLGNAWYRMAEVLWPIDQQNLWKELSFDLPDNTTITFSSFREYVDVVVKEPITSVRNMIYTYSTLKSHDKDPKELQDIRMDRVKELGKVLKAYNGDPPDDLWDKLVDSARTARTRPEIADFRKLLSTSLNKVGVEAQDMLRIRVMESQRKLITDCIELKREDLVAEMGTDAIADATCLEHICLEWYQDVWKPMNP